jgi:hypothetical protein
MKIRHVLVSVVEAVTGPVWWGHNLPRLAIGQPQNLQGEGTFVYNMTKKGISWESDKELIKKS